MATNDLMLSDIRCRKSREIGGAVSARAAVQSPRRSACPHLWYIIRVPMGGFKSKNQM